MYPYKFVMLSLLASLMCNHVLDFVISIRVQVLVFLLQVVSNGCENFVGKDVSY